MQIGRMLAIDLISEPAPPPPPVSVSVSVSLSVGGHGSGPGGRPQATDRGPGGEGGGSHQRAGGSPRHAGRSGGRGVKNRRLKGQGHEIFCFRFLFMNHLPLKALTQLIVSFQIFPKICRDIGSTRCTSGVVDTGGKWKRLKNTRIYVE